MTSYCPYDMTGIWPEQNKKYLFCVGLKVFYPTGEMPVMPDY